MKRILYNLLENDRSFYFYIYNTFSFSMLLISIILTIYDEFYSFHSEIHHIVLKIELIVSGIIAFELIGRFILTENKLRFLFNPLTLIDLLALIPLFQPFRTVRFIVLIARLLRITYRYRFFFEFLRNIFKEFGYELVFVFSLFFVFLFSILLIVFSVEYMGGNPNIKTLFDAVYYVLITATTVGYGDITPVTQFGRLLAITLGVMGIFLFSLITATFSTGFFQYVSMLKAGMFSFREMKNHIVICGWNETGEVLLEELKKYYESRAEKMKPVVVVTEQELQPREEFYYKKGDFVKEEVLKNAGIEHADMVIVLAEKGVNLSEDSIDARSILAAMLARDLNPRATIILEILLRENAKTIKRKRIVDYLIVDGEIVGFMIFNYLKQRDIPKIMDLLMNEVDYVELRVEEEKTVKEILEELGKGYSVLGVKRGDDIILLPDPDFEVEEGDILILVRKKT
ncbi:MAG: potassium channel protein [Aquificae bacterium]|nr:potassium channel protein [Aquificota bacterium]